MNLIDRYLGRPELYTAILIFILSILFIAIGFALNKLLPSISGPIIYLGFFMVPLSVITFIITGVLFGVEKSKKYVNNRVEKSKKYINNI